MSMIFNNIDKLIAIALLISISLYFRILLQSMGQAWIKTLAHTATLVLLPILTYIITNVISGNIALSLGMVGALSIVRFRHPVRSPLELSVYFASITMGIAAAVSLTWLLMLVGSITLVGIILLFLNIVFKFFLITPFFITSFSEGNALSTLQITSKNNIKLLDEINILTSKTTDEHEITYTLASSNFENLKEIERKIRSSDGIKKIQLSQ